MYVTHLKCSKCQLTYGSEQHNQLCQCGAPLLVCYDLDKVRASFSREVLASRQPTLWRYRELLPIRSDVNILSLGEPMTPVVPLEKLGPEVGMPHLYMKNEGLLPTGTFKARGAAVGASRAKELGVKVLALPSNGNAGAAWAAYGAASGIRVVIVMPANSPAVNQKECAITGASLYLVNGNLSDAGKIIGRAVEQFGWYDASTLKEPYRIEGKKTMGLELFEQFNWEAPEVIVYPTGGGVGMIGIYKALRELQEMGWMGEKLPRLVAVQSTGCAPIVKAWQEKKKESQFWEDAHTIAYGLTVPQALGDFLVLKALYKTKGCAVAVPDQEIVKAQKMLASREGVFICPEGAATLSAAVKLAKDGWITPQERIVLLNTGTGLKYTESVHIDSPLLTPDDHLPRD